MKELVSILENSNARKWGLVTDPEALSFKNFHEWVERGDHGVLSYLEGERKDLRENISNYFPEFKSALVFAFDYSVSAKMTKDFYQTGESNGYKIANYVLGFEGEDYHYYLRRSLEAIANKIKEIFPEVNIMHSLDTQPVLERDLAQKAGLGWFGKNSMMIDREIGSYFIIGSLFLDVDLSTHGLQVPLIDTDHCGNCRKCIEACPTDAINAETRTITANKCISTFTIEIFKEAQAPEGMEKGNGEIFGCDICQDVCPWNKKALGKLNYTSDDFQSFKSKNSYAFENFLTPSLSSMIQGLESVSNREYRRQLKGTPLERTGRVGMLKNLKFYKKN
ncbi:epoxyqueuosine reductase [Bacteriovorax sp. Seq25_V]|nr:epoxyqueuosine reductase [Bacteriovorax sp. Seq25_V]